jgi:hypothetical protein
MIIIKRDLLSFLITFLALMDTPCERSCCDKTIAVIATAHLSSFVCEALGQEVAMYRTRAQQSHRYVACQLLYP